MVLPYGIDSKTGKWVGYETRNEPGNGFSHPNNKANLVGRWLLALYDVTKKPVYKERAEKWFRLLKSRMHPMADGTYQMWNYWQPAGPWDYKPDGTPKHWIGVHPNAGYYSIDVEGIVDAYEHGLIFSRENIDRLVATALAKHAYWQSLAPYSEAIQKEVEEGIKPATWGGLAATPKYVWRQRSIGK